MKKNKIVFKYMLVMVTILFAAASCKKEFLQVTPKGKLIAQSVADYNLLLSNNDYLNTGANAQVFMSDDVAAVEPYFSAAEIRTQRLFKWEGTVYEPNENAAETPSLLQHIYAFNKIIKEVVNATDGVDSVRKSIQAEAMSGRAWTYFQLINYYGKPYKASTAATDPGFPVITDADVTANVFNRASVQEVYDFIIKDLTTAIPFLPAKTTHRYRMSKAAAEILLGKVYMFMGRFTEALPQLNAAFADVNTAAIPVNLIDYNTAFATGGMFLPLDPAFGPSTPTIVNNNETLFARQFSNFWITSSELVINPQTVALFGSSDLRLKFFSTTPFPTGDNYPAGMLRRMGPLTTSYGVVLSDLYLLRAETKARLNDLAGAISDVEALRAKRMPAADAPVPVASKSASLPLVKFILDERKREYAAQGVWWFDMRRLSVDPLFAPVTYKHNVYNMTGAVTATFTLNPDRFVLKIPAKIIGENPGMQDNP